MHFKNQDDLKHYVERLKSFYNEFYCFLIVVASTLLIWFLSGGGYFWPVWIMVLWGMPLFFKSSKLGVLDGSYYKLFCSLRNQLPFLKKSWEEEKLHELQKSMNSKTVNAQKTTAKEAPAKKVTAKKIAAKKQTVSKAVTKKAPVKKKNPVKTAAKAATKTTAKTPIKAVVKKAPAKKVVAKKVVTKKEPAKKSPAKKGTPKKK